MKRYKLDITIMCLGMPMSAATIPSGQSLGGSETAAIQCANTLAELGHRITIFCNTKVLHSANGVTYTPMGFVGGVGNGNAQFPKGYFDYVRTAPCDALIVMRQPAMMQFESPAKVNLLWQHDLATKTGPSNFGNVVWNIDKILLPSQFMLKQYQQVHGGPDSLYHVTRNGIDLKLIDGVPIQPRDRFKMMYTARPERGLDILLAQVWPEVLKREPRAKLYISRYQDPATLPLYSELAELAKRYGDSVVNLNNLGKQDLYLNYKQARLQLYPSCFEEISCITSQEVAACGTPMIGPWKGALPETCDGTHVLIRNDGSVGAKGDSIDPGFQQPSPAFIDTFIKQTVDLIHNDNRWERLSKLARQRAEQWQWGPVAEDWTDLLHRLIAQKSGDSKRMIKHFLFNSDVVAAQKYAASKPEEPVLQKAVDKYIDKFLPFMKVAAGDRRTAIAEFYEQRSGGQATDYRTAFWADTEPRLQVLLKWLSQHPEVKSLLDFGCAHGGYVRALSNTLPALGVTGVDVAPSLIRCCEELKAAQLPGGSPAFLHPENVTFMVGDEDTPITETDPSKYIPGDLFQKVDKQFDCVVCMETLEHLPHAEEVIAKLERHCKPNGWMIFTVPIGHRERDEFVIKGVPPVHVRGFDQHDVLDLFGHRTDFTAVTFSDLKELDLDRTFAGWYMVSYRRDDKPVGQIDYERKFFLQAPRETLAVCMITNNSEDVLHRCLRSVQKAADQIVVVDNGPSHDRTAALAAEYTDDVRAGTSPFWCYAHLTQHPPELIEPGVCQMAGFETPRNESIEDVWTDWILWIDSDEQLLDWRNLFKYLRSNMIMGYAMNQYHIAVDPPGILKKDIPVRLFRNRMDIRFFGCLGGDTLIDTTRGRIPIKDLVGQRPWVYCYDHEKERIGLAHADWVGMTRQQVRVLEIELDDGTVIKATPEHPFLLRKSWTGVGAGDYVPASELKPGTRLMPFYRCQDGRHAKDNRGWEICLKGTGQRVAEHRFVYETFNGPIPKGHHVHHKDHDPSNNDPDNLVLMTAAEHIKHHHIGKFVSDETKVRIAVSHAPCAGPDNAMWGRKHSLETKAVIGAKSIDRGAGRQLNGYWTADKRAELNRLTWADPVVRQKRIEGIRRAALARNSNHKVVAVRDGGVMDVYNIEMPSPNHNFAAGGVIVHNCVHEHAELGINKGVGVGCMLIPDVHIHHDGYLTETIRRQRFHRNYRLLQCDRLKHPDRILGAFLYDIRDNMHMAKYAMESNGMKVTPEVRAYLEAVVKAFKSFFLNQDFAFLTEDALNYYSEALAYLGQGLEVCVNMDVKPQGASPNGTSRFRAANKEEAKLIIDRMLSAKFAPFEGPYIA